MEEEGQRGCSSRVGHGVWRSSHGLLLMGRRTVTSSGCPSLFRLCLGFEPPQHLMARLLLGYGNRHSSVEPQRKANAALGSGRRMCQRGRETSRPATRFSICPFHPALLVLFLFVLAALCGLWVLVSGPKIFQTSAVKIESPNHWTTKEFPHSAMEAS